MLTTVRFVVACRCVIVLAAVGAEGGVEQVGGLWFGCGWIAVVDQNGKLGLGSSARFQVSDKVVKQLLAGRELADVVDELSGLTDVRSSQGTHTVSCKCIHDSD